MIKKILIFSLILVLNVFPSANAAEDCTNLTNEQIQLSMDKEINGKTPNNVSPKEILKQINEDNNTNCTLDEFFNIQKSEIDNGECIQEYQFDTIFQISDNFVNGLRIQKEGAQEAAVYTEQFMANIEALDLGIVTSAQKEAETAWEEYEGYIDQVIILEEKNESIVEEINSIYVENNLPPAMRNENTEAEDITPEIDALTKKTDEILAKLDGLYVEYEKLLDGSVEESKEEGTKESDSSELDSLVENQDSLIARYNEIGELKSTLSTEYSDLLYIESNLKTLKDLEKRLATEREEYNEDPENETLLQTVENTEESIASIETQGLSIDYVQNRLSNILREISELDAELNSINDKLKSINAGINSRPVESQESGDNEDNAKTTEGSVGDIIGTEVLLEISQLELELASIQKEVNSLLGFDVTSSSTDASSIPEAAKPLMQQLDQNQLEMERIMGLARPLEQYLDEAINNLNSSFDEAVLLAEDTVNLFSEAYFRLLTVSASLARLEIEDRAMFSQLLNIISNCDLDSYKTNGTEKQYGKLVKIVSDVSAELDATAQYMGQVAAFESITYTALQQKYESVGIQVGVETYECPDDDVECAPPPPPPNP